MSHVYLMSLLDYPEDQHKTRAMCGDPKAIAAQWIIEYTKNLNGSATEDDFDDGYCSRLTVDELVETAMINIDAAPSQWGGPSEYISKGGLLESRSVEQMFWDKLAIILDKEIPSEKRNNFFSCSC